MYNITLLLLLVTTTLTAQQVPSAKKIITDAQKEAAKTDKKVFVKFSASWCTWCTKMEAALKDSSVAPIFNKYYVLTTIIVDENKKQKKLENNGGKDYKTLYGGNDKGLPFWVILNADGNLLANSNNKKESIPLRADGENVGCPTEADEITYFIRVLKATSKLTTYELDIIRLRFEQIKKQH